MSITILIIIVTVLVTLYAWNNQDRYYRWMLNPYSVVERKQYFRLITSGFIHKDYIHLAFNMITLYFFGRVMESILISLHGLMGIVYYLVLYFAGMIIADIPSIIKHRNNHAYNSLGASGAVSAVIFAAILFNPTADICLYYIICFPGFIGGALFLIYSYYQGRNTGSIVNHDAHFYGAVFGILFSILIDPGVVLRFFDQILNFRLF